MLKTIEFPFTKSGFRHDLLTRKGLVCLVQRTRIHADGSEGLLHYEVVRLRQAREWIAPNGRIIPAAENYPSSESWGKDGWTYRTEADAVSRFNSTLSGNAYGATLADLEKITL
jgi:hypothetical protein